MISKPWQRLFMLHSFTSLNVFLCLVTLASVFTSWALSQTAEPRAAYYIGGTMISFATLMCVTYRICHDQTVMFIYRTVRLCEEHYPEMFDRRGRPMPITGELISLTQLNNGKGGLALAVASCASLYGPILWYGADKLSEAPVWSITLTAALNYVLVMAVALLFTWRYERTKFIYLYRNALDNQLAPRTRTNHTR